MISLTNLNAMRSAAAMAESNADIKTSMERLSTGSRINSASDDAAGLAIGTEMNTQIVGMATAIDNAAYGANLMSTADGALDEVNSLLQRMRELAMQAANGTQSDGDLTSLNDEYQSMKSEIARIGANTEWNGKKIFDGIDFPGETKFQVGADAGQTIGVIIDKLAISELGKVAGSALVTHPSTPPSASTTQESFVAHSSAAPTPSNTAGTAAILGSDFDGDGDADIVTIDDGASGFYFFRNDGSGAYGNPVFTSVSSQAQDSVAITIGDIDLDNDVDVIVRNDQSASFQIFKNDGSGNFTAGSVVATAQSAVDAVAIDTIDLDGDGDLDVVTQDDVSNHIETFLNDGNGNFSSWNSISTGTAYASVSLASGDIDGDGDEDLVTYASGGRVVTFENDGSGNFSTGFGFDTVYGSAASSTIAMGDVDGDGDEDLVIQGQSTFAEFYLNNGTGSFTLGSSIIAGGAASFALVDINNDNDQDLAFRGSNFVGTLSNNGSGSFGVQQTVSNPSAAAASPYDDRAIAAASAVPASPAKSEINFSSSNLAIGDRVTISVAGGTNVSAIMDSSGLASLLASLGNDLAAQSSLFSGASNSSGKLTVNGLADGSAMATLSVTLQNGVDTSRFDFNNKNLVEGDQVVIKVTGGTDVQGTLDSNGLDHLLGTLATQLQAQGSLFSNAFVNNGVLGLTGLTDGSAITTVTVSLNTASMPIENTNVSNYSNATTTLGNVDQAIEDVSRMRAKYGATFNQLFAAINNLTTVSANTSSSRSEIEDADYAKESSNLASAQIRNQGAKAMLAQANTDQELTLKLIEDWL